MPVAPLALPAGDFRAYLFDLDGTVADTMPGHFQAWSATLAAHGAELPESCSMSGAACRHSA